MVNIIFDDVYKCYCRNDSLNCPNKHQEFFDVILQITGKHFHPDDWIPESYIEAEETAYQCICSKQIFNLCFLKNKSSGIVVMVGNSCVEKQVPDWKGRLDYLKSLYLNKCCKCCKQRLNLRKKFCKEFLVCNQECKENLQKQKCVDCEKFISKSKYKIRCMDCWKGLVFNENKCYFIND